MINCDIFIGTMNYLQLLPSDLIKEICNYLTDVETKHIIKLRNYIDIDLMIKYLNENDSVTCPLCKRDYRHCNIVIINNDRHCRTCANNIAYCSSYNCHVITNKNYHCNVCKRTFCITHKSSLQMCSTCGNSYCCYHCILDKKMTAATNCKHYIC